MKLKVPSFVNDFSFEGHRYSPAADGSVEVPDHAAEALKCVGLEPWIETTQVQQVVVTGKQASIQGGAVQYPVRQTK